MIFGGGGNEFEKSRRALVFVAVLLLLPAMTNAQDTESSEREFVGSTQPESALPDPQAPLRRILTELTGRQVSLTLTDGSVSAGDVLGVSTDAVTLGQQVLSRTAFGRVPRLREVDVPLHTIGYVRDVEAAALDDPEASHSTALGADSGQVRYGTNAPTMENFSTPLRNAGIISVVAGLSTTLAAVPLSYVSERTCSHHNLEYGEAPDCAATAGTVFAVGGLFLVVGGIAMWSLGAMDVVVQPEVTYDPERRAGHGSLRFTF